MTVAVIADCHLGGPGGEPEPLLRQLAELPSRGCRHLLLMGDIFHVWVGKQTFETPMIRQVVDAFARLRAQGLRVDYIEGNRDFFIARGPYASVFNTVSTELTFEVEGTRYLAVHGDGLNERDRQYLFWRWLSKSLPARWSISILPQSIANRMMHSTEAKLAKTNFKHKTRIPKEAILRFGERRLQEGFDVLLLGHFHEPRSWSASGGEVRILDAWFNHHHIEWLDT